MVLYALAAAGGSIAYVPFLTIILPMQVAGIAGEADVEWLAYATLAGAVTASLANIAFGWLSDKTGSRLIWMWAGLIGSCLLLISFSFVAQLSELIGLLVLWQIALNMMLAPLAALAGDMIPDDQKGLLGGLLAFSPAAGAAMAVMVTLPGFFPPAVRLSIVAVAVAACVLPLLLSKAIITGTGTLPAGNPVHSATSAPAGARAGRGPLARMWIARLLVQISEAALFAFLYFWFQTIGDGMDDASVAQIFAITLLCAVPLALFVGNWSDRLDQPFLPLPICAGIGTIGLLIMAVSTSLLLALVGYVIFGLSTAIFLSLHTGQTLRVLPQPLNRGRDLGIFNLTNTVPSLIMPWLTLALVPEFGYSGLFVALAVCTALATLLLSAGLLRR